jgi:hypothetical protein
MATQKDLLKEYQKIKTELLFEQVNKVIKDNPRDWRNQLEMLGFEWYEEDYDDDKDIAEENKALPDNENQKSLVSYFEGNLPLDENLLSKYVQEKYSDQPNYPLFRRYFRKGNDKLKALIVFALAKYPTDKGYLGDLVFFHEHNTILKEVIAAYITACTQEQDLNNFEKLSRNFWYHTAADGYDALYTLRELFSENPEKMASIENIAKESDTDLEIEF